MGIGEWGMVLENRGESKPSQMCNRLALSEGFSHKAVAARGAEDWISPRGLTLRRRGSAKMAGQDVLSAPLRRIQPPRR
uniref:Uncharacterized protein n=1 Tax=Anguilla anguilla TaxID=7936 RepID=A0A0E9V7J9_ANGAN